MCNKSQDPRSPSPVRSSGFSLPTQCRTPERSRGKRATRRLNSLQPRSEFRLLACPSSPELPKRVPEESSLKAGLQTSLTSEQLQNWPECAIRCHKSSVEHGT